MTKTFSTLVAALALFASLAATTPSASAFTATDDITRISGTDLGSGRISGGDLGSGRISNGDLGSGR